MKRSLGLILTVALALASLPGLRAQGSRADYERSAGLRAATANKVFRDHVDAHWLPGQADMAAQLAAAAAAARDARARLVCMLTLAPDEQRKPAFAMPRQGDAPTRAVNEYVRRECAALGGAVLDAYALTKGAWSRDGTHYEGKTMGMIAQALLNRVEAAG